MGKYRENTLKLVNFIRKLTAYVLMLILDGSLLPVLFVGVLYKFMVDAIVLFCLSKIENGIIRKILILFILSIQALLCVKSYHSFSLIYCICSLYIIIPIWLGYLLYPKLSN